MASFSDAKSQSGLELSTKEHYDETIKIIVQASARMKCSNLVKAKALIIYHHFKQCVHEIEYEKHMLAASALSLSVKFYEEKIELDIIIYSIFSIDGKFPSVEDQEFKEVKKGLLDVEFLMLRMLEFSLDHVLAHQHLIYFLEDVKEFLIPSKARDTFFSVCMMIADDFYLSRKCLNYKAAEIASVIIVVSFCFVGVNVTNDSCELGEWIKGLHHVPASTCCNIMYDIFETSFLRPTADMQLEKMFERATTI